MSERSGTVVDAQMSGGGGITGVAGIGTQMSPGEGGSGNGGIGFHDGHKS
ncbi:MAG TPA: hypothetical protein VIE65_14275 [Methylobacter sp.]